MVSQPVVEFLPASEASASIEAWLSERRIPWEFVPELAITSVDKAASLANQARLEPVVEEVVERYAADMERGDRFPPIVVFRRGRVGRVVIIGGNHRVAAAQRAQKVQATRSDMDALAVVADVEEAMAEARNRSGGGLTRQASARTKMLDALRVIAALDPGEVVGACATKDHRLVLSDRILAAARRLQSTQALLK